MNYEEKLIGDILHYRTTNPKSDWREVPKAVLAKRIEVLKEALRKIRDFDDDDEFDDPGEIAIRALDSF